jgi:hypothetical protein
MNEYQSDRSAPLDLLRARMPLWLVTPLVAIALLVGAGGGLAAGCRFSR